MRWSKVRVSLVATIFVAVAGLFGATATPAAAPPSHEEYVTQAERICKAHEAEAFANLKQAKHNIQKGKAKLGGRELIEAADFFDATGKRLRAIPRPPEDAETLAEWMSRLQAENRVLRKAGVALAAGQTRMGQGYINRFIHNANAARNVVLGFGFKYCLFRQAGE